MRLISVWRRYLTCVFLMLLSSVAAHAAPRVLYLGDSLSYGAFGMTLDKSLRAAGCPVYTMVSGGATPYYWLADFANVSADAGHWVKTPEKETRARTSRRVPKVETLMTEFKPDVVVVQTGTNLYAVLRDKRKNPDERVRAVRYLIERMCRVIHDRGARVYWISPPDSHPGKYPRELQERMRGLLKECVVKYGQVYDSHAVTKYKDPYPANDGIHYGKEDSTKWALAVAGDLVPWLTAGSRDDGIVADVTGAPMELDGKEAETVRRGVPVDKPSNALVVEAVLSEKTPMPGRTDYRHALGLYEYQVTRVISGECPEDRVRVAHLIVVNRKACPESDRVPGDKATLELVPLATYPNLEKLDLFDELRESALPVYTVRLKSGDRFSVEVAGAH